VHLERRRLSSREREELKELRLGGKDQEAEHQQEQEEPGQGVDQVRDEFASPEKGPTERMEED